LLLSSEGETSPFFDAAFAAVPPTLFARNLGLRLPDDLGFEIPDFFFLGGFFLATD